MLLKRLVYWDHRCFCRLFAKSSSQLLSRGSFWISKTADGPLYLLLVLAIWLSDLAEGWQFTQLLLVAFAIELPLYLLLKNSIRRIRPQQAVRLYQVVAHIVPSDTFSLPSGHTAAAFVIVTAVAIYFPACFWLVLVWGGLVGLSRIMLGVHFPLDIFAGIGLGVASCYTALRLL